MRNLLLRSTFSFIVALAGACADDIPEVMTSGSSSSTDATSSSGPVTPMPDSTSVEPDTTNGPSDSTSEGPDTTNGPSDTTAETSSSSSGESSSGGPTCGDDVAEAGEACDGTDLVGSDCIAEGFDEGVLGCMPDCSAYDTSACIMYSCGNDLVEGVEACDGTDLGGSDCIAEGFDEGVLGCMPDCSAYDTSACIMYSCGNDLVEGMEACDGTDLMGSDCVAQGFDEGVLGCMPDCSAYDTSACITYSCGNDLAEGMEACDGTDLLGSDCIGQGFDDGVLGCMPDCSAYDTSACITFSCGNDFVEGMEACDGTDLLGSDCIAQGFDAGVLGCLPNCSAYDTSACITYACGNDIVEGTETCDGIDLAGNTCIGLGFDGGTLGCDGTCAFDTAGCYFCGDGVAGGPEACDGADLLGNDCVSLGFDGGTLGCDGTCAFDTTGCYDCGDNVIGGTEQCDGTNLGGGTCQTEGFDFGLLGCTSSCGYDQVNCVDIINEMEPNDDTVVAVATNDFSAANANGPYSTDTLIAAAINPLGDDDIFAVSNPGPGYAFLSLETYGPIPGACDLPTDTVIEVRTSLNVLITSNDQAGINSCSLLSNLILPPGFTVYVRVIDFGDNTLIPAYHLHIRIEPVVCGDGVAGPGEQCDDGGVAPGDGCSATCVAEGAIQEIEPNGTSVQADATGIVVTGDTLLGGVIGAFGDLDRFRIDLAAPEIVRFETFSAVGVCNNGVTTTLRVFDAVGTELVNDVTTGISSCSAITFPLPAGTYYVQVEETGNNSLIPTYLLEVALQGDTGIETEANDDLMSANLNLAGASNVYVFGDHALATESDYFAIDVPVAGSSVRLEVIEGDRAIETCESLGVDSRITLYNALGVQLEDDDDASRGWCSLIDGTGTVPLDALAHNLAAGTYYVQVRASASSQMSAAGQFIYRLAVTVRAP